MRSARAIVWLVVPLTLAACTTFSTVRSAAVRPGFQGGVQTAAAGPVGAVAGWFWSDECVYPCDRNVAGIDTYAAYGWRRPGRRPFTLGGGVNGLVFPYVEGYVELATLGPVPVGAGARVGIPAIGWAEHAVYARADLPLSRSVRLLYNPGVMWHTGTSPNGETHGTFRGIVHGAGVELDLGRVSLVPSAGYVFGHAEHAGNGMRYGPERRGFKWFAVGIAAHRPRPR